MTPEIFSLIFDPNDVIELRFLGCTAPRQTNAGWFKLSDISPALLRQIAHLAEQSEGAYWLPQVITDTARICRSPKLSFGAVRRRNKQCWPCVSEDRDVSARRYLIVDIDPIRPAGCCATDIEKNGAGDLAAAVVRDTESLGWPRPLIVDSGNGFHLYYRVNPQPGGTVDSPVMDDIAMTLAVMQERHSKHFDGIAEIDRRVYNSSRLMKIPGTWAKKGVNTTERPYRQSKILEVPDGWR